MNIKSIALREAQTYMQEISRSTSIYVFQIASYLEALSLKHWKYEYLGIFLEDQLIGVLPIQYKTIPIVNKDIVVIPYGTITDYPIDEAKLLSLLYERWKSKAIKLQVDFKRKIDSSLFQYQSQHETYEVDLNQPLEAIFSNFSKTHRNCVRKAEKEGVQVVFSSDETYLDQFITYYHQMTQRKDVEPMNLKWLRHIIRSLILSKQMLFAIASYEGVVYNMALIATAFTNARYLYGASILPKEGMPPIGQYLHYEIIKHLINQGYTSYDLGGIPNLPIDTTHPNFGVYKFKKGFGGTHVIARYQYVYYKYRWLKKFI